MRRNCRSGTLAAQRLSFAGDEFIPRMPGRAVDDALVEQGGALERVRRDRQRLVSDLACGWPWHRQPVPMAGDQGHGTSYGAVIHQY
jgi:hypothetical protein